MSGDREGDEPTAARIEALVRAIEARDAAGGAPLGSPLTPSGAAASPTGVSAAPRRTRDEAATRPAPRQDPARGRTPPARSGARRTPEDQRRSKPVAPAYRAPGRPPSPAGPIPGLVGRQTWEQSLVEEAERQQRYGHPLGIVIAEIVATDDDGSAMGAAMIGRMAPRCAAVLLAVARASDRVTRLGISRFGVLLLEADECGAEAYAARTAELLEPWLENSAYPMRLSMGWAVARGPQELRGALHDAEARRQDV